MRTPLLNLKRWYNTSAILLLNVCVLTLLLNVIAYGILSVYDYYHYQPGSLSYGVDKLLKVYPGWRKQDLRILLQETWGRRAVYESFTEFKERPFRGKFVNVDENGFRVVKHQGPWPPNATALNVFVFGSSATFGYGLADDETIPSFMQEFLSNYGCGKQVFVYNFGRAGYYSSQERILFERLISKGFIPNVAVFVDGLNEFHHDESIFANSIKAYTEGEGGFRAVSYLLRGLPMSRIANGFAMRAKSFAARVSLSNPVIADDSSYQDQAFFNQAIMKWSANKKLIEGASKEFGVRPVFVWQPVPAYGYDLDRHILFFGSHGLHQIAKYGYRLMDQVRTKAADLQKGKGFLWLADIQMGKKEPLYVDGFHYTASFSKDIAEAISNVIRERLGRCTHTIARGGAG